LSLRAEKKTQILLASKNNIPKFAEKSRGKKYENICCHPVGKMVLSQKCIRLCRLAVECASVVYEAKG
jgi:hypothetical protein